MLPKLLQNRYELQDFRTIVNSREQTKHYTSVNTSIHSRYLNYDQEPTDIGRLKKLKEFLCSDQEHENHQKVIVICKPGSSRNSFNKENSQQLVQLPHFKPRRKETARIERGQKIDTSFIEQTSYGGRQRFKLKEMIQSLNSRVDSKKMQHRICDKLRVSKIL